jgi:hypothetical protein
MEEIYGLAEVLSMLLSGGNVFKNGKSGEDTCFEMSCSSLCYDAAEHFRKVAFRVLKQLLRLARAAPFRGSLEFAGRDDLFWGGKQKGRSYVGDAE